MTTKDLNLSFDRGLLQPKEGRGQRAKPGNTRQAASPANARPPGNRVPRKAAPQKMRAWQNITIAGIAFTNMLFLVVAGMWLTEHTGGLSSQLPSPQPDIAPQLAIMQAKMNQRIDSLEQQLDNLQISINGQQHLIVSAYQDIGTQLKEGHKAAAPADTALPSDKSNQEAPKTKQAPSPKGWYINLGSFSKKQAAAELQKQFQALGYATRIQTLTIDNQASYAVILTGFKDQASAEIAVGQLLDQTELDGLTVAKEK